MTDDPQVYSCEQCNEDIPEADLVQYGGNNFCSQDCADQYELEEADALEQEGSEGS